MFRQLFDDHQDSSNGLLPYVRFGHGRGNAIATWPGDQRLAAYSELLASFQADDRFIDFPISGRPLLTNIIQRVAAAQKAIDSAQPLLRPRGGPRTTVSRSSICLFV